MSRVWLLTLLTSALLVACLDEKPPSYISPQVTLYPTQTPQADSPATPQPTTPSPLNVLASYDGQWKQIKAGIEQINLRGQVAGAAGPVDEMLVVVRLDLNRVQLKVRYSPTAPRRVHDWLHYEQADVAINGGYFNDQNVATALVATSACS